MFYVLFHWTKGKEKDWRKFSFEPEVIDFIHRGYQKIEVDAIIETARSYHLGLVVTEELIKSVLEETTEEAVDSLKKTLEEKPALKIPEEAILEPEVDVLRSPHPLLKDRKEEKSAMEKIGEDIEEEQKENGVHKNHEEATLEGPAEEGATDEEKVKKALGRGDKAIAAAKKEMKDRRADWPKCPDCKVRPMAPWNTKGKCSVCQRPKGTRKYTRRK